MPTFPWLDVPGLLRSCLAVIVVLQSPLEVLADVRLPGCKVKDGVSYLHGRKPISVLVDVPHKPCFIQDLFRLDNRCGDRISYAGTWIKVDWKKCYE